MAKLGGWDGSAKAGLLFQINKGSEEDSWSGVDEGEKKVGPKGKSTENASFGGEGFSYGLRIGVNNVVGKVRKCLMS